MQLCDVGSDCSFFLYASEEKQKEGKKKISQDGCRKLPACARLTILQGPQEDEEEERQNQFSPPGR